MEFHRGRLIDHLNVRVSNLDASKRFYSAVLKALDKSSFLEGEHFFSCDELWVTDEGTSVGPMHFAFQADYREMVHRFYEAALAAGGRDNGAPGERAYHPGYYAAFVLDPDGHNVEAVFHGVSKRSAPSVVITPG